MCCRWMGSHFHNWIDYNGATSYSVNEFDNGVAFSAMELPEWGPHFRTFEVTQFFILTFRMFVLYVKSKVFFFQYKVDI